MYNLTIREILQITNGKLVNGSENQEVQNFSKDTRNIQKGDMYVGIKGEKFDGNTYYKQAIENGAMGCILDSKQIDEEELKEFNNIILVEDSIKAIQDLATYKRMQYDIPVVAVTGSVGKTSTKDMIASVLEKKYKVLKTQGNNNNHIGLPFTLLKLKDHTAVVVEMGMNHFGEISVLTNIAKPTICVITNIGTAHIGNLGSRENILKAKLEILEGMKKNGTVIVNNDNNLLYDWARENKGKFNINTYGIEHTSNYMAYNIQTKEDYSIYNIEVNNDKKKVKVSIPGIPFIYNSLCGVAVGKKLGIDINSIIQGISELELTKKRMEKFENSKGVIIINDSYNASLDSMKPAIEQLKNTSGNKKIAVLGDMLELGEFSMGLHEQVGEAIVANNIDILITVGSEAKNIAKKAKELNMNENTIFSYNTIEEAIDKIKEIQEKGDVILLKASNSMNFNKIAENLK